MTFPIAPVPKPSPHELELERQRAEPGDFAEWLKRNPPPSIDTLIEKFGSYGAITAQAWADHEKALRRWRVNLRWRHIV